MVYKTKGNLRRNKMKTFKQYLLHEYLLPKQITGLKKSVTKEYPEHDNYMTPKARFDTDHFFGTGNDLKREELNNYDHDKSEVHTKIERHLGKPITHDEYKSGLVSDKYGRKVKIGKLVTDPQLRNEFNNDNVRAGTKSSSKHHVTIVRGIHVGGQTNSAVDAEHPTGHSWGEQSCKNVDTGGNRKYLPHEIANGSVVVRVHDHNNQEIYRSTLQPHYNGNNRVAYKIDSEYGIKHPSFTAHVNDVANRLSGEHFGGNIYHMLPDVYNNSHESKMLHPSLTPEKLTDIIHNPKSTEEQHLALQHKNTTPELIHNVLDKELSNYKPSFSLNRNDVFHAAMKSPAFNSEHITKLLNHPNTPKSLHRRLSLHPNLSTDNIHSLLHTHEFPMVGYDSNYKRDSRSEDVVKNLLKHPKTPDDIIDHYIKHGNGSHKRALAENPSLKDHHIDSLLSGKDADTKYSIVNNDALKLKDHHIDTLLDDNNYNNKDKDMKNSIQARLGGKVSNPRHIATYLNHPTYSTRASLFTENNPHLTSEHIDHIIKHDSAASLRQIAAKHPLASKEAIQHATDNKLI